MTTFVNFGAVLVAAGAGSLIAGAIVADRLGAPADLVTALVFGLAVFSVLAAGFSARTMRPSVFYAAGRAGSAAAGLPLVLVPVLAVAALPNGGVGPLDLSRLVVAVAGTVLYSFLAASPLQRAGGLSFADAVLGRFGSRILALVAGLTGFVLCAAITLSIGPVAVAALQKATGVSPGIARAVVGTVSFFTIFTGGYSGVAACAATATILLAIGWGPPVAPIFFGEAASRGDALAATAAAFADITTLPAGPGLATCFCGLLITMSPAMAAISPRAAQRAAIFAAAAALLITWTGVMAAATVGQKTAALVGLTARALPVTLYSDAFRGQLRVCNSELSTPDDVQRACTRAGMPGPLPARAFEITDNTGGRWAGAVLGLPTALGALLALVLPLILTVGCAAACHATSSALNRDLLRRFVLRQSTASGALAGQRILSAAIILAAVLAPAGLLESDVRITRILLFLAAAVPLPLLLLGLWSRADWRAALCGMASACLSGAAAWFGYLDTTFLLATGAACSLAAGAIAALIFPSRSAGDRHGADVLTGRQNGPLLLDQGA